MKITDSLRRATDTLLEAHVSPRSRSRLARRLHKAIERGSPSMPVLCVQLGEELDLSSEVATSVALAGACMLAAADVADDADDGALASDELSVDAFRLVFLAQRILANTEVFDPTCSTRLAQLFSDAGLAMSDGQDLDITGSVLDADVNPTEVATAKSGNEVAIFIAAPAIVAGVSLDPYYRAGTHGGTLMQLISDYVDFFTGRHSDDWNTGTPTLPIRAGMRDPEVAPWIRLLLAGERDRTDRLQQARHLLVGKAPADLRAAADACLLGLGEAAQATGSSALEDWMHTLNDHASTLIAALQRPDALATPHIPEGRSAPHMALDFLRTDPTFEGAVETVRWGLMGRSLVRGDIFARAVMCTLLDGNAIDLGPVLASLFDRADPDGWRYFPTHVDIPTDADDAGLMLRLAAQHGRTAHPAIQISIDALMSNVRSDGLVWTWLASPGLPRWQIERQWDGATCPVASVNAARGLAAAAPDRSSNVVKGVVDAIMDLAANHQITSPFYSEAFSEAQCLHFLADQAPGTPAVQVLGSRILSRQDDHGRFGNVIETSASLLALEAAEHPWNADTSIRALIDAQFADGGYDAAPAFQTVPWGRARVFSSRIYTTAWALSALQLEKSISLQGSTKCPARIDPGFVER